MGRVTSIIAISSPASLPEQACIEKGKKRLEAMGFRVVIGRSCYEYLHPLERAQELKELASQASCIVCARGGCGSFQLQPWLFKGIEVPIIGYSDITFLLCNQLIHEQPGFFGPMIVDYEKMPIDALKAGLSWIEGTVCLPHKYPRLMNGEVMNGGKAKGRVIVANLSLLMTTLNPLTLSLILKDALLFLEDVGESVDTIERYLWQLSHSEGFKKVRGVVFSGFTLTRKGSNPYTLKKLLRKFYDSVRLPGWIGFPAYHGSFIKHTIPMGYWGMIDTNAQELTILADRKGS